ncbi:MAG TPA: SDR family NAD(P)-dependent oxidoreductase [Candidatus Nanoarchaeia archaeon]|nr:SDR family NAD(P)-dependent oxidoreductase [Candidatus Nanoarchaeia archaeon]
MKCVVTGGCGFLGSRFVRRLLDEGNKVIVFDNLSSGQAKNLDEVKENNNYSFVKGDITNKISLANVLTKDADMVFHLSAIVGVKEYCKDPLKVVDVNVIGTRNVLELSLKNNIKVMFASTSEIFGKNPNTPWAEDGDRVLGSTKIDRWSYSSSKAMCEHMIFAMNKNRGLSSVIVRFFNAYGPAQPPYFVISQSVQKVLKNEQPLLYDSGNQTRCFTFVDDAIDGTMLAVKSKKAEGDVFNIASGKETKIREAVELIIELAGKKGKIKYKNFDTSKYYGGSYEDIPRRVPDVSKAKKILGWEAKTSLHDGLKKTIEWSSQNKWWLDLKN